MTTHQTTTLHASASPAETPTPTPARQRSPSPRAGLWWLAGSVVLAFLIAEIASFYWWTGAPALVASVGDALRLPVAKVDSRFISGQALRRDEATLRVFIAYQRSQAPELFSEELSDAQVRQVVLDRLVHNAILEELAARRTITAERQAISDAFDRVVEGVDLNQVTQQLEEQFGLTIDQYQQLVVRYSVLRDRLERDIAFDDDINPDLTAKANDVVRRVEESTEAFDTLAAELSDDASTRLQGGDLGYVREGDVDQALFDAAKVLGPGERSGLVRTSQGYHIVELMESVPPDADGSVVLHPRHILIRAKSIDTWIAEQLATARVSIYHPALAWDPESSRVVVRGQGS